MKRCKISSKASSHRRRARGRDGIYLVELLVALLIASIIALAAFSMMSDSIRISTTTQNEILAQCIIQELTEFTHSTSYDYLYDRIGDHALLVNRKNTEDFGDASIRSEPLQIDTIDRKWTTRSQYSGFPGSVTYSISYGALVDSLNVTITISWSEGSGQQEKAKILSSSILVTKDYAKVMAI